MNSSCTALKERLSEEHDTLCLAVTQRGRTVLSAFVLPLSVDMAGVRLLPEEHTAKYSEVKVYRPANWRWCSCTAYSALGLSKVASRPASTRIL